MMLVADAMRDDRIEQLDAEATAMRRWARKQVARLQELETTHNRMAAELATTQLRLEATERDFTVATENATRNEQLWYTQTEEWAATRNELQGAKGKLEAERRELLTEVESLRKHLGSLNADSVAASESQRQQLAERNQWLEAELAALPSRIDALSNGSRRAIAQERESYAKDRKLAEEQVATAEKKVVLMTAELAELSRSRDDARANAAVDRQRLEAEAEALRRQVFDLRAEAAAKERLENEAAAQRVRQAESNTRRAEDRAQAVSRQLENCQEQLEATRLQHAAATDTLRSQLAAATSSAEQSRLDRDRRAIQFDEAAAQVEAAHARKVAQLEAAAHAQQVSHHQRIVQLEAAAAEGVATAKAEHDREMTRLAKSLSASKLDAAEQERRNAANLQEAEIARRTAVMETERVRSEIDDLRALHDRERSQLTSAIDALREQLRTAAVAAEASAGQWTTERERLLRDVATLKQEIQSLELARSAAAEGHDADLVRLTRLLNQERTAAVGEQRDLGEKLASCRAEADRHAAEISALQRELANFKANAAVTASPAHEVARRSADTPTDRRSDTVDRSLQNATRQATVNRVSSRVEPFREPAPTSSAERNAVPMPLPIGVSRALQDALRLLHRDIPGSSGAA